MSRSPTRRRASLGVSLALACALISHGTTARGQSAPAASPLLFGPCPAPTFSTAVNTERIWQQYFDHVLTAIPADFDEDGRPDLAIGLGYNVLGDNNAGRVEIWKGESQGRFAAALSSVALNSPSAVATADLNGDGHVDLLYTALWPTVRGLFTHMGDGTGSVGPGSSHPLDCMPTDIEVRDFDGDAAPDAAISCGDADPLVARGSITVLHGDGAGRFGAANVVALEARPGALAVADLNLDGRPDAVVADPAGNGVWVLLADASGVLGISAHPAVGARPRDVQVADVNADGIPDIVTANELSHDVSVLIGAGGGAYTPQAVFPAADMPVSLAIADVNGDGDVDLAVADDGSNRQVVAVLRGEAGGSFGPPVNFSIEEPWGPIGVAVADLNADSRPDLVTANGSIDTVSALLNLCDTPHADVTVASIVAHPDPVPFNQLVTQTLVIANQGPNAADDVVLRALPDAEFVSLSASQGSCASDVAGWSRCALGTIPAGATATAQLVQRATNPHQAGLSAETTTPTLESNFLNNGQSVHTAVQAVGALEFSLGSLDRIVNTADLMWSPGTLQTGYVVGKWVDGVATPLPPLLDASAVRYWDRNAVPGALNCYFVVPVDDAGSLGRSATLCLVPDSRSESDGPYRFRIQMGPPHTNAARLTWFGSTETTEFILLAVPMVEGSTPRWTTLTENDFVDDTGGVNTCYVVFARVASSTRLGYSNAVCAVPGITIAPRGGATTWSAPVIPDGLRFGAARLRAAMEQVPDSLASRR